MTAIFGVDENDWRDALKDILRRLEKKRKEDDKPPGELVTVGHMYELSPLIHGSSANRR